MLLMARWGEPQFKLLVRECSPSDTSTRLRYNSTLTVWPWETVSLCTTGNVKENKKHASDHAHLLLCRLWGYCGLFLWRPPIGVWIVGRLEKIFCLKQKLLFVFCAGLQVHSETATYTMCNQATQDFERAMFGSLDVVLSSIRRQRE